MLGFRTMICAFAVVAMPVHAQSVKLKVHEIEALLSGNTAVGSWKDIPYRQYFDADGSTIFAQQGARSALGQWRVDPTRDEYQSIWPRDADWEGWFVMEFAGDFYWVSKTTPPTPFKVLQGQHLVFPAAQPAEGFCASIAQFVRPVEPDITIDDQIDLPVSDAPTPMCGTSLSPSGQVSRHCHWSFDYRSDASKAAFESVVQATAGCLTEHTTSEPVPTVNHPDSYDLRAFEVEGGTLSVSLKDKGALQKTLIFLRVEHLEARD